MVTMVVHFRYYTWALIPLTCSPPPGEGSSGGEAGMAGEDLTIINFVPEGHMEMRPCSFCSAWLIGSHTETSH